MALLLLLVVAAEEELEDISKRPHGTGQRCSEIRKLVRPETFSCV